MTNRRLFLYRAGVLLGLSQVVAASASTAASSVSAASACGALDSKPTGLAGRSQGFFEIRHQHEFVIPLDVLVNPPLAGYSARSTTPVRGQTDFDGLKNRTDSSGQPLDLRAHAHTVTLTFDQLTTLARGGNVSVDLAKFGHSFYFVADDATLAAIAALKAAL